MEKCKHCQRDKPDYNADQTCAMGGYCDWEETHIIPGTSVMNVSWADGARHTVNCIMHWQFPLKAIVTGLEVEPAGSSYDGFISDLRVGNCSYLMVAPFPFLMWSPGMPKVDFMLPHVPKEHHFSLETCGFRGRVRPKGLLIP